MFGSPKWITNVGKWFSNIFGPKGKIAGFILKIKNMIPKSVMKVFSKIGKLFGGGKGGVFGKITKFLGGLGKTLGKFFWPITVLMSAWEAIKGFIAGFKDTEGGIVEKMIGGIGGAIGALVDFIIMWPLDMIKDLVAWVGEKMGFDTTAIKEFSFSELWADIWGTFMDGVMGIVRFFKAVGLGAWSAFKSLVPYALTAGLSQSPKEAFMQTFNETMAGPVGSKSRAAGVTVGGGGGTQTGGAIVDGNRSLEEITVTAKKRSRDKPVVAIDGSVTVHQEGKKVYLDDGEPTDRFGSRFASWFHGD
jgi:hypothetical protein